MSHPKSECRSVPCPHYPKTPKRMKAFIVLPLLFGALTPAMLFAAPVPAKSTSATPTDPGWPREATKDGVKLTVYQPQIDAWTDYKELKARAAFVLTTKDGKPAIGVMEVAGHTTADIASRTVLISDLKITAARFPSLPEAEVGPMETLLKQTFPGKSMAVSLDRLAAGAEHTKETTKPLDLKMDPPRIFVSNQAAILLIVQGKPVLAPIAGTKLEFVVNTNWDLLHDPASGTYYLLSDKTWLSAKELAGEWTLTSTLPKDFSTLPKGNQWDHVKKAIPPKVERGMTVPKIFYSEEPAELIVFEGSPVWQEVEDTHLLWAKNTESWVLEDARDRKLYFLVSGRWFTSEKWEGPWTFASGNLPEDFKNIPPDSECADVLASVPGTPEAADAVLLAQVPQEAVVNRKEAETKAKVTYDGEPKFEGVEGTSMTYAVNTGSDVIFEGGRYYLCQDAVWFVSTAPVGPWSICLDVPAVIYTIPPAYPVHRVTYVHVESGPSADVVVCRYTEGYFGAFVAGVATTAALVWGSGWYYPPYVAWGGPVPIFRPWPATYGVAAAYNPWTGGYAIGSRAYGPYASAGRAAWYNPVTGNYGRAARVEGPYGARTWAAGYNPRTNTGWATHQGNNGFAQWGTSAVRRGDDWVRAGHVVTNEGGAARWRGSEGGGRVWRGDDHSGGAAVHDGNFYAGRDGNVYRRDDHGNWAKFDHGDWNSVDKKDQLHDARSRYQDHHPDQIHPQANRLGEGGSGQRISREGHEEIRRPDNVPPPRRANTQPSSEVMSHLDRESFNRQRSDFHAHQERSYQPPQRQISGATMHRSSSASFSSRSFSGGRAHGGGMRRR